MHRDNPLGADADAAIAVPHPTLDILWLIEAADMALDGLHPVNHPTRAGASGLQIRFEILHHPFAGANGAADGAKIWAAHRPASFITSCQKSPMTASSSVWLSLERPRYSRWGISIILVKLPTD